MHPVRELADQGSEQDRGDREWDQQQPRLGGRPAADQLGAALRISVFPTNTSGACTGTAIVANVAVNGAFLPAQPTLLPTATRDLCFRATLPTAADTALQGKSTVITLTFIADQVVS